MSRIGPVTARPAPHRQISYPVSTSHRSDLCKNVSLQCHLVATVIHRPSVSSQTCGHIHMLFTIREAGRAKERKKIGTAVNAACQGNLSACHFGYACHRDGSPVPQCNWSPRILRSGQRGFIPVSIKGPVHEIIFHIVTIQVLKESCPPPQSTVVTICTMCFNMQNFAFCPHSVVTWTVTVNS